MADLTFSSTNISDEVKRRTEEFFDLIQKFYKNSDKDSAEYQERVLKLLTLAQDGIDCGAKDEESYTALIYSSILGCVDVVKELLIAIPDVYVKHPFGNRATIKTKPYADIKNYDGNTALIFAALEGHTEIVEALIAAGADVNVNNDNGKTALMIAAENGNTEIVKALIAAGADVNSKNLAYYDIESDDYGNTALILAAQKGHTEVIKVLIEAGADINAKNNNGKTALIWAASNGRTEIVEDLIAAGADVNARDNGGYTALISAAKEGHTEIVEILIAAGAYVNEKNNHGNTALTWAAQKGHTEVVKALIASGADVNGKSDDYNTALTYSALNGYTEIVKVLIAAGADVNAKNHKQDTALVLATKKGNIEIAKYLMGVGENIYTYGEDGERVVDYLNGKLSEEAYQELLEYANSAYAKYLAGGLPSNVEEVQNLLAFHPISPSDNREPFPKMKILESMFWNKDWGLDQAYNLIDALKERKVINEDESAKLIESCKYKIVMQNAAKKADQVTELQRY